MLFERIIAIIIIGGGYLIWSAIFKKYPFGKEYKQKPILAWLIGFLVIFGQLAYIYLVFARLFEYGDSIPIIFLVIGIVFTALLFLMIIRRRRG